MHEKLSVEIEILREISNVLVWENDPQVLLDKVIEILEKRLGMLRGTFTLIEGSELKIAASDRPGIQTILESLMQNAEGED